ncbi:MAG: ATP-binding cassette domain-containing protein [Deltaproteobacteria bacterium]|nr:MAG: ATP-binding cassette domain-containing protein [Deltaproteobacteria bacterium]
MDDGLILDGVVARRGGFSLTADLRCGPGTTAILGPSGAGKSTLLQAVAGFLRPDRGRVVLGAEVLSDAGARSWVPPWRRRVGLVFQEPRLWPHKRVLATIRYGGRYREDDVIAWCGIGHLLDRLPRQLSGGEAQRVAIARALMARPRLLLLDEPFTGLDPARRRHLRTLLETLQAELSIPVLCVTHLVPEALELTDKLVLIDGGHVVAHGDLAGVLAAPGAFALTHALGLENLLEVEVIGPGDGTTRARLGAHEVLLPETDLAPGERGHVTVSPADVLLAAAPLTGVSARNALSGEVRDILPVGDRFLVHVDVGQPLRVEVTHAAARELGLAVGRTVWCYTKTWACRWWD